MNTAEFAEIVKVALLSEHRRLAGVCQADVVAATEWNDLGKNGKCVVDGVSIRVVEGHDSTTGETWYTAVAPKRYVGVPGGLRYLTTPEERFGAGRQGNEPA
mgnify:CR=1 FL=1